jgi:hypothetical protein
MTKTTLLLTSALVAAGFASNASAAGHKVPGKHGVSAAQAKAIHIPPAGSTVLATQSFFGTAGSGFYGPFASLSAPVKKGTRTLAMSAMAQNCGFNGSHTTTATDIVVTVDGSYVDGGPFQQPLNTDDYCVADNWQGIWPVGVGTHTVNFEGYNLGGSSLVARTTERVDIVK